jgi:fermentation-respiration switch protein FrsA (DUF1100 family)
VRPRKTRWLRWLAIVAASYGIFLLLIMLFESRLIFFPTKYPQGDWKPAGIQFEDAWFSAADGTRLHGWFVPHPSPRGVMLVAHGNGGNLSGGAELLREFSSLGLSSMIFDYRGYGRSEGSPNGDGILDDARAARTWLSNRVGMPINQLLLFGDSLGGAVAVRLASEGGARGLIVTNTFSSLTDVAGYHYPWAPVRLLLRTKLESDAAIRSYHGPLLQVHGDSDNVVPYRFGRKLFEAANEPKEFITVRSNDHTCLTAELLAALERFLKRV